MQIQLESSSFEDVLPIWSEFLWPERKSQIKAVSPISMDLKFDGSISKNKPTFYTLRNPQNQIIGTISGYKTNSIHYRCRGLYIAPSYRNKNLSQILLQAIQKQAQMEKCSLLWTLPRKSAWFAYKKFGFIQASDWITEGMEFGPNCLAIFNLS